MKALLTQGAVSGEQEESLWCWQPRVHPWFTGNFTPLRTKAETRSSPSLSCLGPPMPM